MAGDIFLDLGDKRILINPKDIKVKKTITIRDKVIDVKAKYSPYKKVARHPEETGEKWTERYLEWLGKSAIRAKGEKEEVYFKRVLAPTAFDENLAYFRDIVTVIATEFGQGEKVTDESWGEACPEDVTDFIVRILKKCKYPTEEFES